jgi:hypothetical protein
MVTTIASRNSYSERRFLKRDWQIISYRICTMNCLISPLLLCRTDSNPSIAASTSIANIETIFIKSSYIKSAPICIGCASSCLRDRKNIVNNVKSYRESNCISTSSPLWLCSYCNVSPTQNVVWSYTRYSSQCCIGAIAIPSTSS